MRTEIHPLASLTVHFLPRLGPQKKGCLEEEPVLPQDHLRIPCLGTFSMSS